ncbi:MAG: TadE/TadG family type IV pilus assembly protein [Candidatus Binatus sp.]|nr:TadE/TadG family type IV pilus assembly protein [Candidatus Binatus sp.]
MQALTRGQAAVEFALLATLSLIVLMVGIQFAIIGQAALAVTQASYVASRTASVNTSVTDSNISSVTNNQLSPSITAPANALTVNMVTAGDSTCVPNRTFGCQVTVTVTYDATSKIALPNPFLGMTFPTTLSSTQKMMTE